MRSATGNADLSVYSQSAAVLLPGLQLAVASLTPERSGDNTFAFSPFRLRQNPFHALASELS